MRIPRDRLQARSSFDESSTFRIILLTALLSYVSSVTGAQEVQSDPIRLVDAVEWALSNHPAVSEARAESLAAEEAIEVARTAYLPRLDLLLQTNRATRNNVFGLLLPQLVIPSVNGPVLQENAGGAVWNTAAGVLLSWEAVDFGRRKAAVDQAQSNAAFANARQTLTDLELSATAADAFLRVLAADKHVQAVQANVERLDIFADTVRVLVNSDLRPGVEQSRAEAELAAARNRLTEAERDAEIARIVLVDSLGMPGAPMAGIEAGRLLDVPPSLVTPLSQLESHPSAVAAQARIDTVSAREREAARSAFPSIDLQAAYNGRGVNRNIDGSSSSLGPNIDNWAVGFSVTFSPSELIKARRQRSVEARNLDSAIAGYQRTLQALETGVARARANTAAAREIASNTLEQVQAARDTASQANARYDAGLNDVVDVADAERLLAEAEARNAIARIAIWQGLLMEAVAVGDLRPFLQQTQSP